MNRLLVFHLLAIFSYSNYGRAESFFPQQITCQGDGENTGTDVTKGEVTTVAHGKAGTDFLGRGFTLRFWTERGKLLKWAHFNTATVVDNGSENLICNQLDKEKRLWTMAHAKIDVDMRKLYEASGRSTQGQPIDVSDDFKMSDLAIKMGGSLEEFSKQMLANAKLIKKCQTDGGMTEKTDRVSFVPVDGQRLRNNYNAGASLVMRTLHNGNIKTDKHVDLVLDQSGKLVALPTFGITPRFASTLVSKDDVHDFSYVREATWQIPPKILPGTYTFVSCHFSDGKVVGIRRNFQVLHSGQISASKTDSDEPKPEGSETGRSEGSGP